MLGHFQTLLEGIVINPNQRLADLPILTVTERQQLLFEWNNTQQDYPNQCIHQLFEQQVHKTPEAIAVVYKDEQLTYQELNSRSNQLARYLQKLGVAPEVLVGICIERSPQTIVGILGILKAGGAYLPLDPAYPPERLQFMVDDAQVSALLTQGGSAWKPEGKLIYLDRDREIIARESQENPISGVTSANLAYVIYTSGSTGQPKGVLVQHQGLCNLAQAQIQTFELKPDNRILQFASLSFDASIFEIVMALGIGATLYLVPEEARLGTGLISYLRHHAITHATLPPAVLKMLPVELPALQTLISAGEACSPEIVNRWVGARRFFNAYGLTETTVWSTIAEVTDSNGKPSIGRAIANTQVYVLDAHLQPVPIGIPGELYIGGVGVARGYLNRPELTAEKFIPNPFSLAEVRTTKDETENLLHSTERLYKTGDLVRYLPDGNLEFLGRLDRQVKIRGYRIELAEIESLLSQHPEVKEAVVVAREDEPGSQRLVAYVVPNPKSKIQNLKSNDLCRFLTEKLPVYMIPSAFVVLSSLPLTPSGKVDQSALQALTIGNLDRSFVAPRTATEATLATLWAKLLHLEQVSIQDNFFELGGNSLLAIHLLEQVNQQFEQNLPLSDLFIAPTVAQFAPLIEKNHRDSHSQDSHLPWSPLVPLQSKGSKPPFFCVHPIFGVVLPYYELARHLGTEQPFYGLQPFGLNGLHPPLTSIEEMASSYIKAMRQIQPQGPYQLGGWSFGGIVAFEIAQQLHQAGEQVSLLAIMDALAPVSSNRISFWDGLKFLLTTASRSIYPFFLDYWSLIGIRLKSAASIPLPEKFVTPRTWSSLERATISHLIPQETLLRMLDELTVHRLLRIFYANSRASLKYVPQPYPNAIALFRTCEPQKKSNDPTLGWSQLAMSGVQVHSIPGNHLTMLRNPHVRVLAEQLLKYLALAERDFARSDEKNAI
jgi:amino acid adenylation domain-containing protein